MNFRGAKEIKLDTLDPQIVNELLHQRHTSPKLINFPLTYVSYSGRTPVYQQVNSLEVRALYDFNQVQSQLRYCSFPAPFPTMSELYPLNLRYRQGYHKLNIHTLGDHYIIGCLYAPQRNDGHLPLTFNPSSFATNFKQERKYQAFFDTIDQAKINLWHSHVYRSYQQIPLPIKSLPPYKTPYQKLAANGDIALLEELSYQFDLHTLFNLGAFLLKIPSPVRVKDHLDVGWVVYKTPLVYQGRSPDEAINIYGFHTISVSSNYTLDELLQHDSITQEIITLSNMPCWNTVWYWKNWGNKVANTPGDLVAQQFEMSTYRVMEYLSCRICRPVFITNLKYWNAYLLDVIKLISNSLYLLSWEYFYISIWAAILGFYLKLQTIQPKWVLWFETSDPFGYDETRYNENSLNHRFGESPFFRIEYEDPRYTFLYELLMENSIITPTRLVTSLLTFFNFQMSLPTIWLFIVLLKLMCFLIDYFWNILLFINSFIPVANHWPYYSAFIMVLSFHALFIGAVLKMLIRFIFWVVIVPLEFSKPLLYVCHKIFNYSLTLTWKKWFFWSLLWFPIFLFINRIVKFNRYSMALSRRLPNFFYKDFWKNKNFYFLCIVASPIIINIFLAERVLLPPLFNCFLVSFVSLYFTIYNVLASIVLKRPFQHSIHPSFYKIFPCLLKLTMLWRYRWRYVKYTKPKKYYLIRGFYPWLPLLFFHRIQKKLSRWYRFQLFVWRSVRIIFIVFFFILFTINIEGVLGFWFIFWPKIFITI